MTTVAPFKLALTLLNYNLIDATTDLQHFLIFVDNFKNSALTGGRSFLADYKMVSHKKIKNNAQHHNTTLTPIF